MSKKENLEAMKRAQKEAFDFFDTSHTGKINTKDIENLLTSLGAKTDSTEIKMMVNQIDHEREGTIELNDFVDLVTKKSQYMKQDYEDEMRETFKLFDQNHNGVISRDEFKEVMEKMGETQTENDLDEIMENYDQNKDGVIDYQEFVAFWMSTK